MAARPWLRNAKRINPHRMAPVKWRCAGCDREHGPRVFRTTALDGRDYCDRTDPTTSAHKGKAQ